METDIKRIQDELKDGKKLIFYKNETLKYLDKPLGKAIYKDAISRPKIGRPRKKEEDKAHHSDIIKCEVCGNEFRRSHRSMHNQTKVHQAFKKVNQKMMKFFLNEDDE